MKMNNFRGELTDISAEKEPLLPTWYCFVVAMRVRVCALVSEPGIVCGLAIILVQVTPKISYVYCQKCFLEDQSIRGLFNLSSKAKSREPSGLMFCRGDFLPVESAL